MGLFPYQPEKPGQVNPRIILNEEEPTRPGFYPTVWNHVTSVKPAPLGPVLFYKKSGTLGALPRSPVVYG